VAFGLLQGGADLAKPFDPYHKWLGIPPRQQPPHHYRLLAINLFESDPDVIESAADRQMAHVRTYQAGVHSAESQRILNELAAARVCLLNPEKKAAYDAELRARVSQGQPPQSPPLPAGASNVLIGAWQYWQATCLRLWIRRVELPRHYRFLGVDVFRTGRYRERFAEIFFQLEQTATKLTELHAAQQASVPSAPDSGFGAKLKRWAAQARTGLKHGVVDRKQTVLLRKLGEGAYRQHGLESGPPVLAEPIRDQLARLEQLRARIEQLSQPSADYTLSPKQVAWLAAGLAAFAVLFLWSLRMMLQR
jgi:hypothetical protein